MKHWPGIAVLALALGWTGGTVVPPLNPARLPGQTPAPAAGTPALYASLDFHGLSNSTVLLRAPAGLFALREGVLARLDPATLEQTGAVELFGPPAAVPPSGPATIAAANAAVFDRARRLMPAAMFSDGDSLLVLIGDRFFRVDAAALEVKVNVSVAAEGSPAGIQGLSALMQEKQSIAQAGDTLFVFRGNRLFSIRGSDGKVVTPSQLPAPMLQRFFPDNMHLKAKPQ